jgi:uncharacterized membrane protein
LIEEESLIRKPFFEFEWDNKAGPILFFNAGGKRFGLALLCHRLPQRSFKTFGRTWPLCARCTGLLAGFVGAAALFLLQLHVPIFATLLLMVPLAVDGSSQLAGLHESNNVLRLVTGFLFSFGFTLLAVKG